MGWVILGKSWFAPLFLVIISHLMSVFFPSWHAMRSCHHDFLLCLRPKAMDSVDLDMKVEDKIKLCSFTRV